MRFFGGGGGTSGVAREATREARVSGIGDDVREFLLVTS
jgi:hypothetical protein